MKYFSRQPIDKLSEETQLEYFEKYKKLLKKYISKERLSNINIMLDDEKIQQKLIMSPASTKFHGSYVGGLIQHFVDAILFSLKTRTLFESFDIVPTQESVVLCAAFHDFGKIGTNNHSNYIVEESDWHVKNMKRNYRYNDEVYVQFQTADGALYIMQKYGITLTDNEYHAIRTHDGPGTGINESWSYKWEIPLLTHIIRIGDQLAAIYREAKDGQEKIKELTSKDE